MKDPHNKPFLSMDIDGNSMCPIHEEEIDASSYSITDQRRWPKKDPITIKAILNPHGPYRPMWNKIFLFWCVAAIFFDPLFFYIPLIDEQKKCLGIDRRLRAIALSFRSLMDLTYVIHILYQVGSILSKKATDHKISARENIFRAFIRKISIWRYVILDIFALIPIPQVSMNSIFFSKMEGSRSLYLRKMVGCLLLAQYLPRILRIYLSCKEFTENPKRDDLTQTDWVKGGFNFFLYILASHVFGGVWYIFSVERETSCWHQVCKQKSDYCIPSSDYCDDIYLRVSTTLLSESCPINPPDSTVFNFGLFSEALQSGVVSSTDFPRKFLKCFWWGLKNLSSFGANLFTSTYAWENLIAVCVCIVGLLLFLYLIGNVQTYMQLSARRAEERRSKIQTKEEEIDQWIEHNGIEDTEMKEDIMVYAGRKLQVHKDVDVYNLLAILPTERRKQLKRHLCLSTLKQVEEIRYLDKKSLDQIIEQLKPVIYTESSYIFHKGHPIDQMILITQGTIHAYSDISVKDSSDITHENEITTAKSWKTQEIEKGGYYGEEILRWSLYSKNELPISKETLKSHTKVEAFVLKVGDLGKLKHTLRTKWLSDTNNSSGRRYWKMKLSMPRVQILPRHSYDKLTRKS